MAPRGCLAVERSGLAGGAVGQGVRAGVEVAQQLGEPNPATSTTALDRALGDAEQAGGVGHRVTLHIDGHHRSPLLDG